MIWQKSHRFSSQALPLANRHYNRQTPNSPQFVPPGRCLVFITENKDALWVTSWPFAQYVKHRWPGAWVNTLFRNESQHRASDLILAAISLTLAYWPEPPQFGLVTFVDPEKVRPTIRRGAEICGYCYLKAGFNHVGFTKGGLWVWQLLPHEMPAAAVRPFRQYALPFSNSATKEEKRERDADARLQKRQG